MSYYNQSTGFETLVKVAVVAIVLVVVGFITITIAGNFSGANKEEAEKNATSFATELGLDVKHITCVNYDSDNDGYVSCTVAHNNNGKVELMPIECARTFSFNSGCRAQKIVGNVGWRNSR
jgi:hypothetical protein